MPTPFKTGLGLDNANETQEESITIIIGAGSIGLWTALHLAQSQAANSGSYEKIIVIEKNESAFGATSGTCTGCIHYAFDSQDYLLELGEYSFELWERLAQDSSFREEVGWRAGSIYGVEPGDGKNQSLLPDWIKTNPRWDVDVSFLGPRNAMVNPIKLGKWLHRQCENAGIQFLFSTEATSSHLDSKNKITAIICVHKDVPTILKCNKLVVAGGPWTPKVFQRLFPRSSITQELAMDAGDWMLIDSPRNMNPGSIAFVGLNNVVAEKLEFAGRDDGTIWVCGRRERMGELPPIGEGGRVNPDVVEELIERSQEFLNDGFEQDPECDQEMEFIKVGRAFRPSPVSGVPVISFVPAMSLVDEYGLRSGPTSNDSGVYLCWGHGAYGIALGPGTGKIMSQIIGGDEPDIDISAFSIPVDTSTISS